MTSLDVLDLRSMRLAQTDTMQDTCKILTLSSGSDSWSSPTKAYTTGSAISCGFRYMTPRELHGSAEVPVVQAEVRLPYDTTISSNERIQVTHIKGVALGTAEVYEVLGPPRRGPSAIRCNLRLATDGVS